MHWKKWTFVFIAFIAASPFGMANDDKATLKPLYDLAGDGFFKEYPQNPIIKPEPGTYDGAAIGTMTVVKVNGVYHMYYEAWGKGDRYKSPEIYYPSIQIVHATSPDGIHWTKQGVVIPHGAPHDFDDLGTWDPFVLYEDGKFKMWYGGGCDSDTHRIYDPWGYAESDDGFHWVKKGQLNPNEIIPHVEDDRVVHDKKTGHYFMYYYDRNPNRVMRAESPDETHFDFTHAIPVQMKGVHVQWKYPQAFQVGDAWYMLMGHPGDAHAKAHVNDDFTALASSTDGIHWTARNLAVLPRAHDSALLKVADDLYVIYFGPNKQQDENNCDIRLAVFKGSFDDMLKPKK